jgi:TM2 domain-containing membrane protein YozV
MTVFCTKCGAQNEDFAQNCSQCGSSLPKIGGQGPGYQVPPDYQQTYEPTYQPIQPPAAMYGQPPTQDWQRMGADKKIVAGLCGILLGGLGVHKFILGYTTEGVIQIALTFITCGLGSVIGLVEGIIYLTKSDEDFVRTYIQGHKGWF